MFYSQRNLNLQSFSAYTFSYYKSLEITNWDFAEKILPIYLKKIAEDKKTLYDFFFGRVYCTYDADVRNIIGKVIDTTEKASFPSVMFNLEKQRFYKLAAALTLLAIFSESYHFADDNLPIEEDDLELYTTLLKLCNLNECISLSETFCLQETRQKLERKIWKNLDELTYKIC